MKLTRRSFLWGITLAPWLAKPLATLRLPVKPSVHMSCMVKQTEGTLADGAWHMLDAKWINEGGNFRMVRAYIDGERSISPDVLKMAGTFEPFHRDGQYGMFIHTDMNTTKEFLADDVIGTEL